MLSASSLRGGLGLRALCRPSIVLQPARRQLSLRSSARSPLSHVRTPSQTSLAHLRLPLHGSRRNFTLRRFTFPSVEFTAKYPVTATLVRLSLSSVLGFTVILGVILLHDVFTYSERHVDRVPTNPLSLHPRLGGPKNLPIIEANLDDEQDEEMKKLMHKPRLVVLGGGWGSVSLLQSLPSHGYNVTLISPQTYFAFTPLLPSACVGTVEVRSLVEPLRRLVARVRGHYVMGKAVDIDMSARLVEVEFQVDDHSEPRRAYVPYDKLVIGVGSTVNDHGVKGLEYTYQLKTIPDAQAIRRKVMGNLELASLPTTTPEERQRLLSFVVCGGGPTGVEFAAELSDMMAEDVLKYYPKVLENNVAVTVVQSRDHILNTYSEKISEYAEKRFARNDVNVITNARVQEITPDMVVITTKGEGKDAKPVVKELPAGFVLWSTGIAMQPFTKRLVELLPNQFHFKAVQVDEYQRVEGAPRGTVYAIGDGATLHVNMMQDLLELWDKYDINHDNTIDFSEWQAMAAEIKKRYPLASKYMGQLRGIFNEFDKDHDEKLSLNEASMMFETLQKRVTALPATAQVASQQGKYLGGMFTKLSKRHRQLEQMDIPDHDDEVYYHPFEYRHLGSLAYLGNSAVFDYEGWSIAGGLIAMYAWRSVYWSEQTSMRTRVLLMLDWVKRGIFGRDLSKF